MVLSTKPRTTEDHVRITPVFATEEQAGFIGECISMRMQSDFPPLRVDDLLRTMYLGGYAIIQGLFGAKDVNDHSHSIEESRLLAAATQIPYKRMMLAVHALSPSLVGNLAGVKFIRGLRIKVPPESLNIYKVQGRPPRPVHWM